MRDLLLLFFFKYAQSDYGILFTFKILQMIQYLLQANISELN